MDASRHPLQAYSNFTRENVNRIRNISFLILVLKEIENLHMTDFSGSVEDDGCLPALAIGIVFLVTFVVHSQRPLFWLGG